MSDELFAALQDWHAAMRDEAEHMDQSRRIFTRRKEAEARLLAIVERTLPTAESVLGLLSQRPTVLPDFGIAESTRGPSR